MNVGPRDTAVRDIADDCDLEIVQARLALTDRERIEQSLCRMFVSAITAIDDRALVSAANVFGAPEEA